MLIGKFEILATYTYAKAIRDGLSEREAKERGIVAAVMGARARGANRGGPRAREDPGKTKQQRPKPSQRLTAESYDQQVASKMGPFYGDVFLPMMKRLVAARLSYPRVKDLLEIPTAIGAKITGREFEQRTTRYLRDTGVP